MATPLQQSLPRHQYEDEPLNFPTGPCNFTLLGAGKDAPGCGCKRFWNNRLRAGHCMCEHHACFHDHVLVESSRTPQMQLLVQRQTEGSIPDTFDWRQDINSDGSFGLPAIPSQCLLPSENGSMTSGDQSRYTKPFGGIGLDTLCRNSKSVEVNHERNIQPYRDANGMNSQNLTEEANTPSERICRDRVDDSGMEVPSARELLKSVAQNMPQTTTALQTCDRDIHSTPIKKLGSDQDFPQYDKEHHESTLLPKIRLIVTEYPVKMQNHEQRLDLLENASFHQPALDDFREAQDHIDARVSDLEDRVHELEKVPTSNNDSFSTTNSSAMIGAAIDASRIEALEAQVAELQACALPTYSRPWQIEVVFLPYGTQLMGIWSSDHGGNPRSRLLSTATDGWTQSQKSAVFHTASWESAIESLTRVKDTSPWLSARAFGSRTRIAERLRSRGLIQSIEVCGSSASDVSSAIANAFKDLPRVLTSFPHSTQSRLPKSISPYLGLQSPFVPLRKYHKQSTLSFLSPAEMLTPTLWTVPFLSNVAMKQRLKSRLFVTTPDAYIQHLANSPRHLSCWTWARLRLLPRFISIPTSLDACFDASQAVCTPEADAGESCWEFDEHIDRLVIHRSPESLHSSLESQLSIRISQDKSNDQYRYPTQELDLGSPSGHFSSAETSTAELVDSPARISVRRRSIEQPRERRHFPRLLDQRTVSMPVGISYTSPQLLKRCVPSFEETPDVEATEVRREPTPPAMNTSKRQRISRSPSRPREFRHHTPRRSTGPPSPFVFEDDPRAVTPFAYATPHSNAPYLGEKGPGSASENVEVWEDGSVEGIALSDYNDIYEYEQHDNHGDENDPFGGDVGDEAEGEWDGVQDVDAGSERTECGVSSARVGDVVVDIEHEDMGSESGASSVPSEYPSTQLVQHGRGVKTEQGFRIHVDFDADEVDAKAS